MYYLSEKLYREDIINGTTLSLNLLSDFKIQSEIATYLPKAIAPFNFSESYFANQPAAQALDGKNVLVVMASVSDSQGGITNLTQLVEVNEKSDYDLTDFETQWEAAKSNMDNEVIFLTILAPKLASLDYNSTAEFLNISESQKTALAVKQDKLYKLQKDALAQVQELRESVSSKATEESLQKTKSVLLDALKMVLDAEMLIANLDDIDAFVQMQQQIIVSTQLLID